MTHDDDGDEGGDGFGCGDDDSDDLGGIVMIVAMTMVMAMMWPGIKKYRVPKIERLNARWYEPRVRWSIFYILYHSAEMKGWILELNVTS